MMAPLIYGRYINSEALAAYLLRRRNPDGGFCFYSLDESNLKDTFYAVLILDRLGRLPSDDKTIKFIRSFQDPHGGFYSVDTALCALKALSVLEAEPARDAGEYATGQLKERRILKDVYIERLSIFETSYYIAEMLVLTGHRKLCENIADDVLRYRKADGSFGGDDPSLISTYHALSILEAADKPMGEFAATADYINARAVQSGGFTKKPTTGLAFMDETCYGVMALELLGKKPEYLRETIDFIADCQNENGGFRRARASGISGFDTSYYALESLRALLNI
jgi:hypothetical protein